MRRSIVVFPHPDGPSTTLNRSSWHDSSDTAAASGVYRLLAPRSSSLTSVDPRVRASRICVTADRHPHASFLLFDLHYVVRC